ncbi:hypothetical protein L873DRAFT_234567 [Choiromyces venosus 120613-1]|uniref:Uncharacterized protein n=1 Tax=Choiromyces venosus 120613-1 TaxID=1336337 RepID=A0A3N4K1G2_9PEZI|nr:hypothetical protein L873DRAFT_234567 [Choiromyces venosus 120613-1]
MLGTCTCGYLRNKYTSRIVMSASTLNLVALCRNHPPSQYVCTCSTNCFHDCFKKFSLGMVCCKSGFWTRLSKKRKKHLMSWKSSGHCSNNTSFKIKYTFLENIRLSNANRLQTIIQFNLH